MLSQLNLPFHTRLARIQGLGYALADDALTILTHNKAIYRWIALPPTESLVGHHLTDIFPELVGVEDVLQQIMHRQLESFQLSRIHRPDNIYFDLQIEIFSDFDHTLLLTITDVTAEAQLEHQLRQERNELRLNIARRERAEMQLAHAKEVAEAANQAKTEFLANMSHELRTPLTGILGFAEMILEDSTLSESHQRAINVINQSGKHLLALINDVLDLSKIDASQFILNPGVINLPHLLHTVVDMMSVPARNKNIDLFYYFADDLPPTVYADERRLRQILLNLLGNAVKFTAQGRVTFRAIQTQHSNDTHTQLQFAVEDTGPGIPADKLDHVFKAFYRLESTKTAEGTGLGLAISQRLAEAMHGSLRVTSVFGQGSTFWFDVKLPIIDETRLSPLRAPAELPTPPPKAQVIALHEAAKIGDITELEKLLTDIQNLNNPDYIAFTTHLRHMVKAFLVSEVQAFIKRYL